VTSKTDEEGAVLDVLIQHRLNSGVAT